MLHFSELLALKADFLLARSGRNRSPNFFSTCQESKSVLLITGLFFSPQSFFAERLARGELILIRVTEPALTSKCSPAVPGIVPKIDGVKNNPACSGMAAPRSHLCQRVPQAGPSSPAPSSSQDEILPKTPSRDVGCQIPASLGLAGCRGTPEGGHFGGAVGSGCSPSGTPFPTLGSGKIREGSVIPKNHLPTGGGGCCWGGEARTAHGGVSITRGCWKLPPVPSVAVRALRYSPRHGAAGGARSRGRCPLPAAPALYAPGRALIGPAPPVTCPQLPKNSPNPPRTPPSPGLPHAWGAGPPSIPEGRKGGGQGEGRGGSWGPGRSWRGVRGCRCRPWVAARGGHRVRRGRDVWANPHRPGHSSHATGRILKAPVPRPAAPRDPPGVSPVALLPPDPEGSINPRPPPLPGCPQPRDIRGVRSRGDSGSVGKAPRAARCGLGTGDWGVRAPQGSANARG